MTDSLGDSTAKLPLRISRLIDELCDTFEAHLAAGRPAVLGPFLERIVSEGRPVLVAELVGISIERLRDDGVSEPNTVLVAMNPELKAEIEAALVELSDHRKTVLFEGVVSPRPTPIQAPRHKRSRGLHIRCPHCSNHVELVGDTPLDSINCTVCGSNFSLVDRSTETRMAEALQTIDRFELVSRIGMGGFGTVWKARDTDLDRTVAIKIPRHGQLTAEEMEQFFREARSVAQLRHPNIVSVHEVGREGDAVFIVSDLIRGVSLADLLTGKRPSPKESAALCATLADALDHAHRKGVIHRDLKPSNVMIDNDSTPFLMDFGLAKREAEEVTMTTDGQIIGTPAYMSPEQASGRSAWADRRTDIYSLGVILFELLTGEPPFRGNAQMQVHLRLTDEAPNVLSLNGHLPKDLATICAKCLEREPGRRFQSAKVLGDELRRYLEGVPIESRPIAPIERLVRWAARRPLQAIMAAVVTFLAVAGPSVALVIEQQRVQLERKYAENANLILKREQESRDALANATAIESQLAAWEGRANPWSLWPPNPAIPPKRRQLASLFNARSATLAKPSNDRVENVQRLIALATLCEGTGRPDDAQIHLIAASEILERILEQQPTDIGVALALADCFDRLSMLTSAKDRDDSLRWLDKALRLLRTLAGQNPTDAELQALRLDAEMRSGAAAGFKNAGDQLAEVQLLDNRLTTLWPTSPAEIYRLACLLAGRHAWLAETDADSTAPTTAPRP